ncbi:MAG: hypothetical protein GTN40_01410, partial [Candidatus Aenigmarchaeota archaeon]|nr:hypothetical protein [Candidatus Aenigmarchaeota archaeon]
VQIKNILSELAPRLNLLRRQAKKAKEREEVEKGLKKLLSQYYSSLWYSLTGKIEDFFKDKKEAEKEVLNIRKEIEKIQETLKKEEKNEESKFREIDALRVSIEEATKKRDTLKEKFIIKLGKLEVQKNQAPLTNKISLEKEEEKFEELNKKIVQYNLEIENKNQKIKKLKKELKIIVQKLREEKSTHGFLEISNQIKPILSKQKNLILKLKNTKTLKEIRSLSKEAEYIYGALEEIRELLKSEEKDSKLEEKRSLESKISLLEIEVAKALAEKTIFENQACEIKNNITEIEKDLHSYFGISTEALEKEVRTLKKKVFEVEKELDLDREKLRALEISDRDRGREILDLRDKTREKQDLLSQYSEELTNFEIELAKLETKRDDLNQEIQKDLGVDFIGSLKDKSVPFSSLSQENLEDLELKIEKQRQQVFQAGAIDPEVIEEFNQCETRHNFLSSQLLDLEKAKADLEKVIKELDGQIKNQFYSAFDQISKEFSKFFSILFGGGKATLILKTPSKDRQNLPETDTKDKDIEVIDEIEIPREGIEIQVSPPERRINSLSALSGGERSLTSLALLCAILTVNPSPFCVLDEVDAALDESNTQKFLSILKELAKKTQFIIITHNRETMKEASVLYGVTMGKDHISRLLSIKLEEAEEVAEAK